MTKKIITSAVAFATVAALLVAGTFAWQSISQQALNEKEAAINPGGRLHDDFDGANKDVYVENFAADRIFARIRLDEYFEITVNKGTPAETVEVVTEGATKDDVSSYITHLFGSENATDDYLQWTTGGQTVFMPTFNKNKDSLKADINGTFANDYEDYEKFEVGDEKTDNAVYDDDENSVEDENVVYISETHYAENTANAVLISMDEWINDYSSEPGDYWVYDEDGWVYYARPIEEGEATGLLLDGISLKGVMDDSYYYAINVVGQFITADDLGKDDGTGFYADGRTVSENALALLEKIGVKVGESTDDGEDGDEEEIEVHELTVTSVTEGKSPFSVEGNLGDMYIGARVRVDGNRPVNKELELIDGFTLKVYEQGGTDPVCVKTGDDLMYDIDHDEIIAEVTNDGLPLNLNGETVFEVEIIYSKGETTITADRVSYTFSRQVFDLSEEGSTYEGLDTNTCAFITLDGKVPNWADLQFAKDGTDLVCQLNSSGSIAFYGLTKDGENLLELDGLPNPIRFQAKKAGTYTIAITVDGTTYTATVTIEDYVAD